MQSLTNTFIESFNTIDFKKIIDHPNILIAARFWDEERYQAALTCYKLMRAIDDLVDNYKTDHIFISEDEKSKLMNQVEDWLENIGTENTNIPLVDEVSITFRKFSIPKWTMESFARSMIYDIKHDGFATLDTFLEYAEGASVAPAAVFVHLAGLRKEGESYALPLFNVREAARSCAVFSYLVHIIRDFKKDQNNNLMYFSEDLMKKHGLTRTMLKEMAKGNPIIKEFRNMIKDYYEVADLYRIKTYDIIQKIKPLIHPRYQLSLDIIFNLYLMVFDRIDYSNGNFSTEELNPTSEEIKKRVYQTIIDFKLLY